MSAGLMSARSANIVPGRDATVVRLDGRAGGERFAPGGAPTLRALAALAAPHADPARAVRRIGRVVASGVAEARVAGLSAHLSPGDVVLAGGVPALVARIDRAVAVVAPDRPGARPDDTVEAVPPPPRADASWLGRAVDPLGEPLDAAGPLPGATAPDHPPTSADDETAVTGVGLLDALVPVRFGEAWSVLGPAGSGRTGLLRMVAAAGAWDAVVVCALRARSRERAAWLSPAANRLSVLTDPSAGPAECALALTRAMAAARDLARTHPRVALLVDGAERLDRPVPPVPGVATLVARRTAGAEHPMDHDAMDRDATNGDAMDGHEGAIVLDGTLAARGMHPAVDLAATLALSPPPVNDDGTHGHLRSLAAIGEDVETLRLVRAAIAQSPPREDAEAPDPGAIVTREALAALVAGAGPASAPC